MRPTGSRARWPTALALLGLALLAAGVGGVVAFGVRGGLDAAGKGLGLLTAALTVAGAAVAVVGWAARRRAAALRPATGEQVGQAAATLVELVREQWTREAQVRALGDPEPMPVRWRLTTRDVMDHPALINPDGPVTFAGRSDRIGPLADAFRALPRRRLVISGGPGTGKTTLSVQLLLELLPPPDVAPTEPVPVLFSLVGWDPAAQPRVQDWLVAQLNQTYPALGAIAPDAAAALVARERILPVLDGLDEVAETRRPAVVRALNASLTSGLILTSRRPEFRAAVAAAGDVVTAAATIGPLALRPGEAASYLRDHLPPNPGPDWDAVLTDLATNGAAPLAALTATPFGLWLLRAVYVDTRRDAGELVDRLHTTASELRRHLMEQLVPSMLASRPADGRPRDVDPGVGSRPARDHDPDDLRRWLTTVAEQVRDAGSRDWQWWDLPRRVFPGRRARLAVGLVAGVAVLLLNALLGVGLQETGGGSAPVAAAVAGALFGLPAALVLGFVAARSCERATAPRQADLRVRGRGRGLVFGLVGEVARGLAVGGLIAVPIGLIFAPALVVTIGQRDAVSPGQAFLIIVGMLLAVGGPSAALFGLMKVVGRVDPEQRASTPTASRRADRFVARVTMIGGALVLSLTVALVAITATGLGDALLFASAVACWFGIPIAVAVGLRRHPSPAAALAVAWSALRGRLPWRLMPVLDDAYRLGLLRTVGPVYQFRHAELQDHLAPPRVSEAAAREPAVSLEPRGPAATA